MTRVLLVDDEALVRRVARVVLEAEGYEVSEASDAQEALEAVRREPPQVVILDLLLPGTDGVEVCRSIKRESSSVKVIVLTSLPAEDAEAEARSAGADAFLTKPFSSLELLQRVGALASG